ncbi:zinc ribbon domain-containing protein [Photorhabdus bodei]|uniref:Putative zinc-ribbon domain-containing protein n=1 Tax=Photorhabdus bodei TaxID=2029681 RepID=A0AAW6BLX9_9GAMM|nr:hypothetical protein [Photorhabdus bodei]MDB6374462.1 hypothetical protein [Photorhabdus bodei]
MKGFGYFLLILGLIWLLVAFNIDTTILPYGRDYTHDIGTIATKHNHIFFGAFVTLCGLMMILFGRSSSDVRCSYCAEFINKDARKCKHCGSDIKTTSSAKALARTLVLNSEYLKRAENYHHCDFVDEDSNVRKQQVVDFCALCLSYIDEVECRGGDGNSAERKVASMVADITTHLTEEQSKEFKKICEFHLP